MDKTQTLTILDKIDNLDIITKLRLATDLGELIKENITETLIAQNIEENFEQSDQLFAFINLVKDENETYAQMVEAKLSDQIEKNEKINVPVLKLLLVNYSTIQIETEKIISSLQFYTPKLDKESLTKDGEFFKSMVKLAKERSSDQLK